jgi:hypothetical protein
MPEDFIKTEILEPPPIDKLAMALSKAQAVIEGASKDTDKYADLGACWAACRKPLSDNGLAIIQIPHTRSSGRTVTVKNKDGKDEEHELVTVTVKTILTHSSGQSVEGELSVLNLNVNNPSQGIGSCITYLRRYALCSFVGVSPEDDDGNSAGGGKPAPRQQPSRQASTPPHRPKASPPPPAKDAPQPPKQGPSEPQLKRLFALLGKSAWGEEDLKKVITNLGLQSSRELSQKQYKEICDAIVKDTP